MNNTLVKFVLKLGLELRRKCRLKTFIFQAMVSNLFIRAIMVKGLMRNSCVKLF